MNTEMNMGTNGITYAKTRDRFEKISSEISKKDDFEPKELSDLIASMDYCLFSLTLLHERGEVEGLSKICSIYELGMHPHPGLDTLRKQEEELRQLYFQV